MVVIMPILHAEIVLGQSSRELMQSADRAITPGEFERIKEMPGALKPVLQRTGLTLVAYGSVVHVIDGQRVIAFGTFPQYRGGVIEKLIVSESGASVFVDGRSNDFLITLDPDAERSNFEAYHVSPDPLLYREPCSWWKSMWNECDFAQWEFEPTKDQMTVQGYLAGSREQIELIVR